MVTVVSAFALAGGEGFVQPARRTSAATESRDIGRS
jgi:hypothetical protein